LAIRFRVWLLHAMGVIALSVACFSGCSRMSMGPVLSVCVRPTGAAVKDSHQAIQRARAAWYCVHWSESSQSESEWLAEYEAYNKGQIWHVSAIIPEGFAGGGPVVEIAAQDGRVLDMLQTQ
jgi:hypothetical protein